VKPLLISLGILDLPTLFEGTSSLVGYCTSTKIVKHSLCLDNSHKSLLLNLFLYSRPMCSAYAIGNGLIIQLKYFRYYYES